MKKLSNCRVLLVEDAKANLDILVEGLKPDHKLSLAVFSHHRIHHVWTSTIGVGFALLGSVTFSVD